MRIENLGAIFSLGKKFLGGLFLITVILTNHQDCLAGECDIMNVTFVSGHAKKKENGLCISTEFIIYDRCQPIGIFEQVRKLHKGEHVATLSLFRYTDSSAVLPDQMSYIESQFRNVSSCSRDDLEKKLLKGEQISFVLIRNTDGTFRFIFEPSLRDLHLSCLLKYLRMPAFLFHEDVMTGFEIESMEIAFHEIALISDLRLGDSVHLIDSKEMERIGLKSTYFGETHKYEDSEDIQKWVGVFNSGELYAIEERVFVADMKIEFCGMNDIEAMIKKHIRKKLDHTDGKFHGEHEVEHKSNE